MSTTRARAQTHTHIKQSNKHHNVLVGARDSEGLGEGVALLAELAVHRDGILRHAARDRLLVEDHVVRPALVVDPAPHTREGGGRGRKRECRTRVQKQRDVIPSASEEEEEEGYHLTVSPLQIFCCEGTNTSCPLSEPIWTTVVSAAYLWVGVDMGVRGHSHRCFPDG